MRRDVASLVVIGFFSFLLVGTSKAPSGTAAGGSASTTPSSTGPATPTGSDVPSTAGMHTVTLAKAKVQLSLPSGWKANESDGTSELAFTVGFGRIEVGFHKPTGGMSKYVHVMRTVLEDQPEFTGFFLKADDAVLVRKTFHPPIGNALEGVVCGKAGGRELCAIFVGFTENEHGGVVRVSDADALELVAVARSIREAP